MRFLIVHTPGGALDSCLYCEVEANNHEDAVRVLRVSNPQVAEGNYQVFHNAKPFQPQEPDGPAISFAQIDVSVPGVASALRALEKKILQDSENVSINLEIAREKLAKALESKRNEVVSKLKKRG